MADTEAMGFQRLTPIHSLHEESPELADSIDEFVVGLGEWIDGLQDSHAAQDLAEVEKRAEGHAERSDALGYPSLRDGAGAVAQAAHAGDLEAARKAIGDLIELVQRVRLGHRSAA